MYRNYIFDLYGTLADIRTNEGKPSLWKHTATYLTLQGAPYTGAELKKTYRRLVEEVRREALQKAALLPHPPGPEEIEVDLAVVFRRLYTRKGVSPTGEAVAHLALLYRTLSLDYLRLYDGAKELLETLRSLGRRVFLLSNAQRLFTEPELRSLGIFSLFDDVFISSDTGFLKPSPRFYQALLQKHDIAPEASVMIGNDWQADAWGTHRNGLAAMYLHTAQSPEPAGELPPGCRVLNSLAEVLK